MKNESRREIVNFLRSSPMQQLKVVLLELSSFSGISNADRFSQTEGYVALVSISLLGLALIGISEKYAWNRFSDYKSVKEGLERFGWSTRLIEPKSHSWCQRHAAKMAAIDSGYEREIKAYFQERGFKWYHFWPDFKSKNPGQEENLVENLNPN